MYFLCFSKAAFGAVLCITDCLHGFVSRVFVVSKAFGLSHFIDYRAWFFVVGKALGL